MADDIINKIEEMVNGPEMTVQGHKVVLEDVSADEVEFWGPWDNNEGGMRISWLGTIGFGQLTIVKSDGKLICESEYMSDNTDKRFIKLVLQKLIDSLEVVE